MSSSLSERRVLHVVVRPPWSSDALARALAHRRPGDVLLLAQDAVGAACASMVLAPSLAAALGTGAVRVLAHDLAARGLDATPLRAGVAAIDDAGWVALVVDCATSVTWA